MFSRIQPGCHPGYNLPMVNMVTVMFSFEEARAYFENWFSPEVEIWCINTKDSTCWRVITLSDAHRFYEGELK